jgi:porin
MNNLWQLPVGLGLFACITLPASAADDASRWGVGDWGGTRSELLEKGVDFTLGYVG